MITLPTDIQLQVLSYIRLPSDLKALCLTSKACRVVASPRLYRRIVLKMWNRRESARFVRCMVRGGGLRLGCTRSLAFEDNQPPVPVSSKVYLPKDTCTTEEKDHYMYLILQMFPDHCLRTFRFVSDRDLAQTIRSHLGELQAKLSHVQITCSYGDYLFPYFHTRQCQLRHLDIQITEPKRLQKFLDSLYFIGSTLERLSIGSLSGRLSESSDILVKALEQPYIKGSLLPNLKELSLNGLDLKALMHRLWKLADPISLVAMTIDRCEGVSDYLGKLGTATKAKQLKLEHLAVQICDDEIFGQPELCASSVKEVLAGCKDMKSLHIAWAEEESLPVPILEGISLIGANLTSLSIYGSSEYSDLGQPLSNETFHQMCINCPNIRQLGYRLAEDCVLEENWAKGTDIKRFMDSLRYLPELRMLHLRQYNVCWQPDSPGPNGDHTSPLAITKVMERFADNFFSYLQERGWCTKVNGLALGVLARNDTVGGEEYHVPQHCFVKGYQTDIANRTIAVGVLVTRDELRLMEPESDVLCCDWDADWVGARPGRFCDL